MADVAVERVNVITLELDRAMQAIGAVDGRDLSFGSRRARRRRSAPPRSARRRSPKCVAPQ